MKIVFSLYENNLQDTDGLKSKLNSIKVTNSPHLLPIYATLSAVLQLVYI